MLVITIKYILNCNQNMVRGENVLSMHSANSAQIVLL